MKAFLFSIMNTLNILHDLLYDYMLKKKVGNVVLVGERRLMLCKVLLWIINRRDFSA